MALELQFAKRADTDLDNIYRRGAAEYGIARADSYAVEMMNVLNGLCDFPRTGPLVEGRRNGLRRKFSGVHVIFYVVSDNAVRVIRILHQRMDPSRHL